MPRIQFSDVTPPERRSIRDIPIPNSGKRKVPIGVKPEKTPDPETEPAIEPETVPSKPPTNFDSKMSTMTEKVNTGPYEYYYPKDKKGLESKNDLFPKSKKRIFVWGTIAVIVVFILSMMTILASATVDITPKTQTSEVLMNIVGVVGEAGENNVRYEVIKLSESKTATVPATGEEAVELKASGKIMIYNNFSPEPQRLIVRTRFETPEGLVFRIPESVVVPGKTVKAGVETPGSIEVEIFADEAGEKYNIKKTDFTVPGFKNDSARYKGFYARSVTDMIGGFIGKRKVASPADEQVALQNIDSEVEMSLKKNLESKIPEGLTLLSGSIMFKAKVLPTQDEASSVIVGKEITAYAMIFNKQDLSKIITDEYVAKSADWNDIKPLILDFSHLEITNTPVNFETNDKMDLQIKGKVQILADIDTKVISERLLGSSKKDVAKIVNEFAGISSISAAIRPIWKQSFPTNPAKIYVQTVITQ